MLNARLSAQCPPLLRDPLERYLAGGISAEILLMQLVVDVGDTGALITILRGIAEVMPERKEVANLLALAVANADHLGQVTALAKGGLAQIPSGDGDRLAAIRDQFDRAVALAPEASVALYSLGSAEILERATTEIVERLADWRLLRSDVTVLDIGCGIGRIERVLAHHVGRITAIDISAGMIEEARRRCADLPNVGFEQCNGQDLAGFESRSFDLVLGVDSFPYLFAADPAIAAKHVRDAARLLRSGGALTILNFSYRGDDEADRRDVDRLATLNGFAVQRAGTRDFTLWDGLSFVLTLPDRRE